MSMAEPLLPPPGAGGAAPEPGSDVERDQAQAAEQPDGAELPIGELPDPPFRTPEPRRKSAGS